MAKLTDCTTPRANPNVNYELWVIVEYQHRFMNCNKCPSLVWDVHSWGGSACVKTGDIWEFSVPSTQVCCKPETSVLKGVY